MMETTNSNVIYTITVLQKIEKVIINEKTGSYLPSFGEKRCIGYFDTLKNAFNAIKSNGKYIHDNFYNYCIIEEVPKGIYKYTPSRYFFEWKNTQFVHVDEPIEINKVTNFSIG